MAILSTTIILSDAKCRVIFGCSPLRLGNTDNVAFFTFAFPNQQLLRKQVLDSQFVPPNTMRLMAIFTAKRITSQLVHCARNGFYVERVHAASVATQVVTFQIAGGGRHKQTVKQSVGQITAPTVRNVAIAIFNSVLPLPTRIGLVERVGGYLNRREKAGKQFTIDNARIWVGLGFHSTSMELKSRAASTLQSLVRPVLILAHLRGAV